MNGSIDVVKGHGTENDFVVVVDERDEQPLLGQRLAARICDRRSGLGADGLIRAFRTAGSVDWTMDYWNSDGTTGLMCGNGIRVMAEVLHRRGLLRDDADIITGSGVRHVERREAGIWAVEMGVVTVGVLDGSGSDAAPGDSQVDTLVAAPGLGDVPRPGLRVDVGNPHVVVAMTGGDELAGVDLRHPPRLLPQPAAGANVEFVTVLGRGSVDPDDPDSGAGIGRLAMRVHERGSGETRSCGTGAVAAAAAATVWAGPGAPRTWSVAVPGGQLQVELDAGRAVLVGPVVVVGDARLDAQWLAS